MMLINICIIIIILIIFIILINLFSDCNVIGHTDRIEEMGGYNRVWTICRKCGEP